MESLKGVDRMMMSGTRATLVLKEGVKLSEKEVKEALTAKKLTLDSITKVEVPQPGAAFVAKTPEFT